jgi:D-alanyl-D-alanine carboxypeptidase
MKLGRWRKVIVIMAVTAKFLAPGALMAKSQYNARRHDRPIASCGRADCRRAIPGPTAAGISSIVVRVDSGQVLAQKGADIPRYPASLTKLMTLDLAFRALHEGRIKLDTPLPVSKHASGAAPVKLYLKTGSTLTVRQAILAMTTMSANDAATVLGEYLGHGSEPRFARMMTRRAHALGMKNTAFRNSSGLPNAAQVTTARDLSVLTRDLIVNYPEYQHFFMCTSFTFGTRTIYSNNQMLKLYRGTIGMKTGYTDLARHNLITAAKRRGVILIGVVLHEPSWGESYNQMTAMLDAGFDSGDAMLAASSPAAPAPSGAAGMGSLLIPAAEAATITPIIQHKAGTNGKPAPRRALAESQRWTAQVGSFSHYADAHRQAETVRRLRGVGTAQVLKFHTHGRTLWAARITGLTPAAARRTCHILAAEHKSCFVVGHR